MIVGWVDKVTPRTNPGRTALSQVLPSPNKDEIDGAFSKVDPSGCSFGRTECSNDTSRFTCHEVLLWDLLPPKDELACDSESVKKTKTDLLAPCREDGAGSCWHCKRLEPLIYGVASPQAATKYSQPKHKNASVVSLRPVNFSECILIASFLCLFATGYWLPACKLQRLEKVEAETAAS